MKFNPYLTSLAAVLCLLLFFSCTTTIEFPPPPPENLSSSSVQTRYCVYLEIQQCYEGSYSVCPPGGILSNTCPYSSSSSLPSSSSADLPSSSSGAGSSGLCGGFEGDEFIDPRDCKRYKYRYDVANGRVWMMENLNYSKGGIGYCYKTVDDEYTLGTPGEDLPGCNRPYGRHYTYEIATDGNLSLNKARGICPEGWHIPNADEWETRMEKGIPDASAGNYDATNLVWKNRGSGGFYWYSGAVNGSNWGFVFIWGSTFQIRPLKYFGSSTDLTALAKSNDYFSVRCIMDMDANFTLTCDDEPFDPRTQQCGGVKISYDSNGPQNTPCGGKTVYIKLPDGWGDRTYILWESMFRVITGTKEDIWTKFTLPVLSNDRPDRQEIIFTDGDSWGRDNYVTKTTIGNGSFNIMDGFKCSDFGEVTYIKEALVNVH